VFSLQTMIYFFHPVCLTKVKTIPQPQLARQNLLPVLKR